MRKFFAAILTVCAVLPGGFLEEAQAQQLSAGAAKESIVPPFPTPLAGYFDRTEPFAGVRAPIFARAVVFESGSNRVAIVGLDLLAVSRELRESACQAIRQGTGIPAENVLICAGHIHSAPAGFHGSSLFGGGIDERLVDFLAEQIAGAVSRAAEEMRPAKVGYGSGRIDTITRNRQQGNTAAIDPEVGVLRVEAAESGSLIATLFNFTGHPVVQGSDNLLIAGGYPGAAAVTVEGVLGGVALFTQGACGDVTMIRNGSSYEEAERLGHVLAGEVIKTVESISPGEDAELWSVYEPVTLPARTFPPAEEAEQAFAAAQRAVESAREAKAPESDLRRLERALDDAEWEARLARFSEEKPGAAAAAAEGSMQAVQVGPLILAGFPGELFVEYGLEMKQRVAQTTGRHAIVVGFSNDYLGYLVTPRAAATGGYEMASRRVEPAAGRVLLEAALSLIESNAK